MSGTVDRSTVGPTPEASSASGDSAVLTVIRLSKVIELVLGEAGLTLNQYRLLTFVEEGPPALREVSFRLAMKPPNVSVLIDGLVDRGLIGRHPDPGDGRRIKLVLTDPGRDALRSARDRCGLALAHLASTPGAPDGLLAHLGDWHLALDAAAIDLREELAGITKGDAPSKFIQRRAGIVPQE